MARPIAQEPYGWWPRAVVEMTRPKNAPGFIFNAEIAFDDAQYVVSTGHKDRDVAMASSQAIVNQMIAAMRQAGTVYVASYKRAKE